MGLNEKDQEGFEAAFAAQLRVDHELERLAEGVQLDRMLRVPPWWSAIAHQPGPPWGGPSRLEATLRCPRPNGGAGGWEAGRLQCAAVGARTKSRLLSPQAVLAAVGAACAAVCMVSLPGGAAQMKMS